MLFLGQPQPTGFFFAFHKRTAVFFSKRPRADVRLGKPVGFKLGYRAEDGSLYSWLAGVLPAAPQDGAGAVAAGSPGSLGRRTRFCCHPGEIDEPRLLIRNGYQMRLVEHFGYAASERIHFIKPMS